MIVHLESSQRLFEAFRIEAHFQAKRKSARRTESSKPTSPPKAPAGDGVQEAQDAQG